MSAQPSNQRLACAAALMTDTSDLTDEEAAALIDPRNYGLLGESR